MKIIFLNLYSEKIERGAESQAHQLAEQLQKKHNVIFIKGNSSVISDHGFEGNLFQKWFNRKRWFIDEAGLEILRFSLREMNRVWKEKPDWVIPMNGFWQVLLLKLLQPFARYKILITGHSGPGWDERWNLYLKPDVFVASTGPAFEWARKACPWIRVEMIPYGIEVGKFNEKEISEQRTMNRKNGLEITYQKSYINHQSPARHAAEFSLDLDFFNAEAGRSIINHLQRPIVLCPSALVPYKRVDFAIKAVAKMEKGSLIVLGKGPLENELRKLGKKLLGEKRFYLGSVSYEEMPAVYAAVDLVTLPSTPQENSPMVFVEALAAGKPVVATDAPRVRWALEDSGFYVDPEDQDEYVKGLEKAAKSKVNTQKHLEKFLWENVLEKYERVFVTK